MNEQTKKTNKPHSLILDNRANLVLTGVNDVAGFDEETVNVFTDLGGLIIKGTNMHINKLNLDSGEVAIDGNINSLQYITSSQSKGMFSKLFK